MSQMSHNALRDYTRIWVPVVVSKKKPIFANPLQPDVSLLYFMKIWSSCLLSRQIWWYRNIPHFFYLQQVHMPQQKLIDFWTLVCISRTVWITERWSSLWRKWNFIESSIIWSMIPWYLLRPGIFMIQYRYGCGELTMFIVANIYIVNTTFFNPIPLFGVLGELSQILDRIKFSVNDIDEWWFNWSAWYIFWLIGGSWRGVAVMEPLKDDRIYILISWYFLLLCKLILILLSFYLVSGVLHACKCFLVNLLCS